MKAILKRSIAWSLRLAGVERSRRRRAQLPSPLYKDPQEALLRQQAGEAAAIEAPLSDCVIFNGLSLSPTGWHPFVYALLEALVASRPTYVGSRLESFYDRWQPNNAQEALLGANQGPSWLANYPPILMHAPWLKESPDERLTTIRRIIEEENRAHGDASLGPDAGYGLMGPVTRAKGEIEYSRLVSVALSIRALGYDRSRGDITAQVLRDGDRYRYRIVHGHHRAAALAALGHETVALLPRMLVDVQHINHWPQVRPGYWSRDEAASFFFHHFEFNSRAWAAERGLLE